MFFSQPQYFEEYASIFSINQDINIGCPCVRPVHSREKTIPSELNIGKICKKWAVTKTSTTLDQGFNLMHLPSEQVNQRDATWI